MKKTLILTLAATLASGVASLSGAAHAGSGGVKLHFNGPLGSFVARPSKGAYASAARCAPKKASAHAARRTPASDKPTTTAARSVKKVYSNDNDNTDTVENGPTGSKALIQAETTKVAAIEPATAAPAETVAAPAAEAFGPPAPAETATDATAPVAAEVAEVKTDEPKTEVKASEESEKCKKFVPAVGVTISVGC